MDRTEDAIPLEAELTVSQLRDEKAVGAKLRRWHRVRVRRYGEVLGVLLDRTEWRRLTSRLAQLESQIADYEEAGQRALVRKRAEGNFEAGKPGRAEAIFDEAEAAVAAAGGSRSTPVGSR
jgi:hypothetical protein